MATEMPMATEMLCIGQSHMVCVLQAAELEGTPVQAIALKEVRWFGELEQTEVPVSPFKPHRAALRRRREPTFAFIGGLFHMTFGLKRHPQPFDFVLPAEPGLPIEPDAELIPSSAMVEIVQRAIAKHLRLLERLAILAGGPVYQFEPPPPPADSWLIERAMRKSNDRVTRMAGRFLRYKLWRLHSDVVRAHAERAGAHFVGHPPEAADGDGFLRPELCRNTTHANVGYGSLVLEQMRRLT
jgi:hypothetical protein